MTFNGQSGRYYHPVERQENFVEPGANDPVERFLYVMHRCRGQVMRETKGFATLEHYSNRNRTSGLLKHSRGHPFGLTRNPVRASFSKQSWMQQSAKRHAVPV